VRSRNIGAEFVMSSVYATFGVGIQRHIFSKEVRFPFWLKGDGMSSKGTGGHTVNAGLLEGSHEAIVTELDVDPRPY
jgi:hypothetical protein